MSGQAITPQMLLRAYAMGVFPMAESASASEIHWFEPKQRGIFPLDRFHVSQSLRRHILRCGWDIRVNTDFAAVVAGCADRPETWINPEITALYQDLHHAGHAHSLEVWQDSALIGGVYGVTLGAAFFGESMFSRRTNASKTALAYLVHRLNAGGFKLFDTQFLTPHLASLGAIEIPRPRYKAQLDIAIRGRATFTPQGYHPSSGGVSGSGGASSTSGKAMSATSQRSGQTS